MGYTWHIARAAMALKDQSQYDQFSTAGEIGQTVKKAVLSEWKIFNQSGTFSERATRHVTRRDVCL